MNLNSIKYFAFVFCLFVFGERYLFSLENANHGNMKIICPDNDFEKPVSNPIFHIEIYEHDVLLHDEIRNIINMKIDEEQKLIYSSYMLNGGRTEYYVYSFVDDKLVEIDCMIQQENDGNKRYSKSDFSYASLEYEDLSSFWKSVINLYD